MQNKIVYMDNNATTKVDEQVLEEMLPFFCERYGNPSSMHSFGGNIINDIEKARKNIADLIGAGSEEIIFTACGTESDNAAILSCLEDDKNKKHIITTKIEHPAVLGLCKYLEENKYDITYLSVNKDGMISLEELENSIRDDTSVVSIMYANNETGVIFPVLEAAEIVNKKGVFFHSDAVQAVGKVPIDMSKNKIDFMSFSGHKLHAPKGVGVLYIRKGVKFYSFMIGGHQEKNRRAGTENIPSIVGMGKSFEIAKDNICLYEKGKVKDLRDKLEKELEQNIPDVIVNGKNAPRTGNTLSMSFKYIEGESILLLLDEVGICASSGSACTSGSLEPSHVLRAMDLSHLYEHGTIRFSLSRFTQEQDIDYVVEHMPGIVEKLRKISPFR